MSVYTVYEPPLRARESAPNPERFVFVRDGFYFWAFLATWLWLLWHRMWLVLLLYVLVVLCLEGIFYYFGVDTVSATVADILVGLLIGIEASSLRRFSLTRRGFTNVGVVVGDNLEAAEQRFFSAWVDTGAARRQAPVAAAAVPVASVPRAPPVPGIVGLFPEPGAQ
jgi:hypothetical protein